MIEHGGVPRLAPRPPRKPDRNPRALGRRVRQHGTRVQPEQALLRRRDRRRGERPVRESAAGSRARDAVAHRIRRILVDWPAGVAGLSVGDDDRHLASRTTQKTGSRGSSLEVPLEPVAWLSRPIQRQGGERQADLRSVTPAKASRRPVWLDRRPLTVAAMAYALLLRFDSAGPCPCWFATMSASIAATESAIGS